MSLVNAASVQHIGECTGYPGLSDEAASTIASDLENRIRELIQESCKFARHAKRRKLTPDDLNKAMRVRNIEPVYGYSSTSSDVSAAWQFKRVEGQDTFVLPDREVDLAALLAMPLPKSRVDVSFEAHWLAVEGVQPAIPQNPPIISLQAEEAKTLGAHKDPKASGSEKIIVTGSDNVGAAGPVVGAKDGAREIKSLAKHTLSAELQLYHANIVEALLSSEVDLQERALHSVASDPGLPQLVPYFCQFVADQVTSNMRKLAVLTNLIKLARSLLQNPYLNVEPYLHQLLPPILTCVVAKILCEKPTENHWALRDLAASLTAVICRKFQQHKNIQIRITKTMIGAFLDPQKPLSTHYGAIVCLHKLGVHVVETVLLDNISVYSRHLERLLQADCGPQTRLDAAKVEEALVNAVADALNQSASTPTAQPQADIERQYTELYGIFAEKLLSRVHRAT